MIKVTKTKKTKTKDLGMDRLGNKLEPKWDNPSEMSGEQFYRQQKNSLEYYRLDCGNAQYKKWTLFWVEHNEKWKNHLKALTKYPENQFNHIVGGLCRLIAHGVPDVHPAFKLYWESLPGTSGSPQPLTFYIEKELTGILNSTEPEDVVEKKKKPAVELPNIQERLRDISYGMMTEINDAIELLYTEPDKFNLTDCNPLSILRSKQVKSAHARIIKEHYQRQYNEYLEVKSGQCEQLKEAYSHLTGAQLKKMIDFFSEIISACDMLLKESKISRAPRIKKPALKTKVVSKMKYLKQDEKLKLVSINPVDIIEAQTLWVYNVKTRKLGKYVADSHGGVLGVKGTSIIGFDHNSSVQKTLRRPDQQIKEFGNSSKIELRKFLENIKATEIKLNGRINSDTILLKVL